MKVKRLLIVILCIMFSTSAKAAADITVLADFANNWLNECEIANNWCNGYDADRDSLVNFVDYSIIDGLFYENISFKFSSDKVIVNNKGNSIEVSLKRPILNIDGRTIPAAVPIAVNGVLQTGEIVEVTYPAYTMPSSKNVDVKLFLQWHNDEKVLRKWASIKVNQSSLLKDVELDRIYAGNKSPRILTNNYWWMSGQSYPVFVDGYFFGIEFPIAKTRVESDYIILALRPGKEIAAETRYESEKAIYGLSSSGKEVKDFKSYIKSHSIAGDELHVNYNSWWTHTNANPYTENDVLNLMETFKQNLFEPYGVALDTFCLDLGWSEPQSIWQIRSSLFPNGFVNIDAKIKSMNGNLGIWLSPSVYYAPALDTDWAYQNGYEVSFLHGPDKPGFMCVGGPNYKNELQSRMVYLTNQYDERHFKIDGWSLGCNETNHGHQTGDYSVEHTARNGIDFFNSLKAISPDVWIETTCFGWNASPWWLFTVDSVIGTFGDDSPPGRVPCPSYRESYTTARDFFNLQGSALLPIPASLQEVLGVVHQSNEPLLNDAVTVLLRGNQFLPLYINPAYMNDIRWHQLADVISWGRQNWDVLSETEVLLPVDWQNSQVPQLSPGAQMPRTPYGYAHWSDTDHLIGLRNPWVQMQSYTLTLDEKIGFKPSDTGMSAVSLYPEVRIYAQNLNYGDTLEVNLAPYETLALSINNSQGLTGLPLAQDVVGQNLSVTVNSQTVGSNFELNIDADIVSGAPQTKFFVVIEGSTQVPSTPSYVFKVNNVSRTLSNQSSDAGFHAAAISEGNEYWRILETDISQGNNKIELQLPSGADCQEMSLWVWTSKAGGTKSDYPNAIISPEKISLAALPVGTLERNQAHTPSPSNGEYGVDISPALSWDSGANADSHEVYFGTSYSAVSDATIDSPEHKATLSASNTNYSPGTLENLTNYYWRVDENADGVIYKGTLWQFKTKGVPIDPDLLGWWKFDETSGTVVHDSSGRGYDGILHNGNSWTGNHIYLDGIDDYIEIPENVLHDLSSQVTVAFWQYGTGTMPVQNSIFRSPYVINVHLPFANAGDGTQNAVYWDTGYSNRIKKDASSNEYLNKWNHWAFTKNAATGAQQIYLNGQLWHSVPGNTEHFIDASAFWIGAYQPGLYHYKGNLRDFRVYKRVLSSDEIQTLADD